MFAILEIMIFSLMIITLGFISNIIFNDKIQNNSEYKKLKIMRKINIGMIILLLLFMIISNLLLNKHTISEKIVSILFNEISILVIPIITLTIYFVLNKFMKNKIKTFNKINMYFGFCLSLIYLITPFILAGFNFSEKIRTLIPLFVLQVVLIYILLLFIYDIYLMFIFDNLYTQITVSKNYIAYKKDNKRELNKFNKRKLSKSYKFNFLLDEENCKKIIGNEIVSIMTKKVDE